MACADALQTTTVTAINKHAYSTKDAPRAPRFHFLIVLPSNGTMSTDRAAWIPLFLDGMARRGLEVDPKGIGGDPE